MADFPYGRDKVIVRDAEPADMLGISLVRAYTWLTAYSGFMDQGVLDAKLSGAVGRAASMRGAFHEQDGMSKVKNIVAVLDGTVIGFASYLLPAGMDKTHRAVDTEAGELKALYVLEACHGMGVGKKLISEVERRLAEAGCCSMLLDVHHGNTRAEGFYKHMGAEYVGSYDGKYGQLYVMQVLL